MHILKKKMRSFVVVIVVQSIPNNGFSNWLNILISIWLNILNVSWQQKYSIMLTRANSLRLYRSCFFISFKKHPAFLKKKKLQWIYFNDRRTVVQNGSKNGKKKVKLCENITGHTRREKKRLWWRASSRKLFSVYYCFNIFVIR